MAPLMERICHGRMVNEALPQPWDGRLKWHENESSVGDKHRQRKEQNVPHDRFVPPYGHPRRQDHNDGQADGGAGGQPGQNAGDLS